MLGAKGLKDYEYEKKAGNLILTVNGEKITLCVYGGDPINMSTGNYVYSGEFLSQKGLFPIAFNITYNSIDRNNASLGVGFYSDIDIRMDITESKAKITYSDGRREVFIKVLSVIFYASISLNFSQIKLRHSINYSDVFYFRLFYPVPSCIIVMLL